MAYPTHAETQWAIVAAQQLPSPCGSPSRGRQPKKEKIALGLPTSTETKQRTMYVKSLKSIHFENSLLCKDSYAVSVHFEAFNCCQIGAIL